MISITGFLSYGKYSRFTVVTPEATLKRLRNKDIAACIREFGESDVKITCYDTDTDITRNKLLTILKSIEPKSSDIDLNNVIRNGGFTEYIKKLELE